MFKINPVKLWLLFLFSVFSVGALQAQSLSLTEKKPAQKVMGVPELRDMASQAYAQKNYLAFKQAQLQLHRARPNNSDYMYHLVLAHALLNEKTDALNIMLQMQRQGLSYDFTLTPDADNLKETSAFNYFNDLMAAAGEPFGLANPVITLDKKVVLPEAIDWDPQREAFMIGTVQSGSIYAVSMDGEKQELVRANQQNGIWGIYDIAVDVARNRLWASSASNPQFSGYDPADKGRSVLLEFDLESMELIKRYPVPVDGRPHNLANIALAPNGDIYVSDGILPLVYLKKADESKLQPFYGAKGKVSLRGLTISDDGRFLYIADYEMGIDVVDLEVGQGYVLKTPETLNVGGIDGLYYWNGHLVIIQNGISPQRIMSLELDGSGRQVSNVIPLVVALEIMDYPNYGTVVGDEFYFFANSHWAYSDDEIKPVVIAGTSLTDVSKIISPDAERFMEQYQKAQAEGRVKPAPVQKKSNPGIGDESPVDDDEKPESDDKKDGGGS